MQHLNRKQVLIPIASISIMLFMYFGPLPRTIFENIVLSLIMIVANYFEYKGKPWAALGFYRKNFKLKNLLIWAPITAFGLFLFYVFALVPSVETITGVPIDLSSLNDLEGNLPKTLVWLAVVWLTAAFGEEIIFRGYLMRQLVKFLGETKIMLALNILICSAFFGYMHLQQGITGQLVAGSLGALFALLFYLRKYDLWFLVMVHGIFNTFGILSFYFGLAQA